MVSNFFSELPSDLSEEVFEKIAGNGSVKIERIISNGQSTPAGQWYDQTQYEWVMLLKGEATLEFDLTQYAHAEEASSKNATCEAAITGSDLQKFVQLKPGDHLTIDPNQRHRVASTSTEGETLWLAVFYD
ncbi:cupin [Shewanella acanthi]|uniref:cupin n=1 Tax=Shewanella acanthi TaxID=2864212 RepID=UPI001C660D2B|nr:cupin [Shewanella acanthi]QYJ79509.1 cupin [Shewanella acanthi]